MLCLVRFKRIFIYNYFYIQGRKVSGKEAYACLSVKSYRQPGDPDFRASQLLFWRSWASYLIFLSFRLLILKNSANKLTSANKPSILENISGRLYFPKMAATIAPIPSTHVHVILTHFPSRGGSFPGDPVVKTPRFQCRGCGFDPWMGNKIPHAPRRGQKIIIIIIIIIIIRGGGFLIWVALTNYHWLYALNNKHLFFIVLEAGSPRSGCHHGWVLVRAPFWVAAC